MSRPFVLLVDGAVYDLPGLYGRACVGAALSISDRRPSARVAICRPGDARSLRRFEAGREVTT